MKRSIQILIALGIVTLGILLAVILIKTKPEAQTQEIPKIIPQVEVRILEPTSENVSIRAYGTLMPSRQVQIQPQVQGKIIWKNENLKPGLHIKKNEILAKVDPTEYKLMLNQQESNLARAKLELSLEKARQKVAERDFERLGTELIQDEASRNLALRKPYLEQAEKALNAAESSVTLAKINLDRTQIRAPFDGYVTMDRIEIGSVIGPQAPVATVISSDAFWATVAVPLSKVELVEFPTKSHKGSSAKISLSSNQDSKQELHGTVTRLLKELDPLGKMAQVVIETPLPNASEKAPAILPGARIEALISGKRTSNIFRIPRAHLYESNQVWVVNSKNQLELRPIHIAFGDNEAVYVDRGVQAGDQLLVTYLAAPINGMDVHLKVEGGSK